MITLPALQSWLGQELELRGIDAVIYTRYILSILQQDNFEPDAEFDPFHPPREVRSAKGRVHPRRFRKSWTAEDWKKYAVLECLQAVSDKDCDIESLVEELCVKLKRIKEERDRGTKDGVGTSEEDATSPLKAGAKAEHHDNPASQAAKYYQAFPALSDKTNTIMMSDSQPHGAWGPSKKSPPQDGQQDTGKRDRKVVKSVSASASRRSKSPARKHQRAKSLPNSGSHQDDTLMFVVPKYQSKKGRKQTEGRPLASRNGEKLGRVGERLGAVRIQAKSLQQPRAWERNEQIPEVLNVSPSQSPEFVELAEDVIVDENEISWYTEPVVPVLEQGRTLSKLQTVYRSASSSPYVKTPGSDISLEEAVNSLAESLCRDIFDDDRRNSGGDQFAVGPVSTHEGLEGGDSQQVPQLVTAVQSLLEGDTAERGRHGDKPDLLSLLDCSKPDLYPHQERNASSLQAMPLLVVDSQASLSMRQDHASNATDGEYSCMTPRTLASASSSQEHLEGHAADLTGAAYPLSCLWEQELPQAKEPWERSPLPVNASGWSSEQGYGMEQGLEQKQQDSSKIGDVQDLPEALKVMVDHDKVVRSAVGSLREEESLLRICCPTHSHHQCPTSSAMINQFLPGNFPFSEESFGPEAPQPSPTSVLSCSDPGSPFYSESEQDSLAKGIKSACHLGDSTPTAVDPQPSDINSALWSTYDTQPRYGHPPKIVRWEDSSFARDGVFRRRKSSFIEGGVYGSPYSSQNNSHYNSCSTSPCESGSLRNLWNPAAVQEVSDLVTSMKELISPESGSIGWKSESRLSDSSGKRGAVTPEQILESSQQDEQSLIEDSLMDSPVFICSRSSSRFEFARSVSDLDGSLSPVSAAGTETDEMVSEAELLEEALKDVGEIEEEKECNKTMMMCKLDAKDDEWSESLKCSLPTDGSSQELTPSWLTPPPEGSAAGLGEDPCSEKSQGSLSLTGIVPTISKPEAIWKGKRPFDLAVGGSSPLRQKVDLGDSSLAMDELLISPKTHFRPIHETISPDDSSGDEGAVACKVLDSPHPGSLDELSISKVVGSVPRKSPAAEQWPRSNPLATDPVGFPTNSPNRIGGDYHPDDGAWVKGQSGHPSDYNIPWIARQPSETHHRTESVGGHVPMPHRAELDPTMHLDYENQMFTFEDEACLKGEGFADVLGGTVKPLYSSELEEMWLGEAAGDAKQASPPWRKHRRKLECPFAHDVSGVTCRFWKEGQCLKGDECPFMHGYNSDKHSLKCSKSDQAETLRNSRRKKSGEREEDICQTRTQVNAASPGQTPDGAIPFCRRSRMSTKLGRVSSDASPNHARSLPISIRPKPR